MIKIYHNPRCRKSREGLEILKQSDAQFEIIKYLDNPISEKELVQIISKLDIKPLELVRKNEVIWKENYKNKILTDSQIIKLLTNNPKLIERPIVIANNKAVIGRPPDLIKTIL